MERQLPDKLIPTSCSGGCMQPYIACYGCVYPHVRSPVGVKPSGAPAAQDGTAPNPSFGSLFPTKGRFVAKVDNSHADVFDSRRVPRPPTWGCAAQVAILGARHRGEQFK
ncbi:hypothetical protein N7478_009871 [Penicillium angulare]|uniref:uncharacterized protein n=1 Tax=Penicillium angulare TaxID=116970 RepID=UPI00253F730F|nr:uncharacterized protein N7478_009871 [Penicillium angulare]KAJ5267063.1 hypothetical protein N7478_009871 [Penicillium angulare]